MINLTKHVSTCQSFKISLLNKQTHYRKILYYFIVEGYKHKTLKICQSFLLPSFIPNRIKRKLLVFSLKGSCTTFSRLFLHACIQYVISIPLYMQLDIIVVRVPPLTLETRVQILAGTYISSRDSWTKTQ